MRGLLLAFLTIGFGGHAGRDRARVRLTTTPATKTTAKTV